MLELTSRAFFGDEAFVSVQCQSSCILPSVLYVAAAQDHCDQVSAEQSVLKINSQTRTCRARYTCFDPIKSR
jgi:hypothetical protein